MAKKRFPEGLAGVTRLHALIAEQLPDPGRDPDPAVEVMAGIETERGAWVASLVAVGYTTRADGQRPPRRSLTGAAACRPSEITRAG